MTKNRVIPQMFDVRPVDKTGNLDWKKINEIKNNSNGRKFTSKHNQSEIKATLDYAKLEGDVPLKFDEYINASEKKRIYDEVKKREMLEARVSMLEAELSKKQKNSESLMTEKSSLAARNLVRQQAKFRIQERIERENKEEEEKRNQAILLIKQRDLVVAEKIRIKKERKDFKFAEKIRHQNEKNEAKLRKEYLIRKKKEQKKLEKKQRENERRITREREAMRSGHFSFGDIFSLSGNIFLPNSKKAGAIFAVVAFLIVGGIGGASFVYKGVGIKGNVLGVSQSGYASMTAAIADISNQNFEGSSEKFTQAFEYFTQASSEMDQMGSLLNEGSRFFPLISKISSGKNILEAGAHLSLAGRYMNEVIREVADIKTSMPEKNEISFLDLFEKSEASMRMADEELTLALENIEKVKIDDLPVEMQDKFLLLKSQLPKLLELSEAFLKNSNIFSDLLGGNGPRKYLFLFQNNNEMRATGGFIGSYGLLDISNGHIRDFFIDGIYNPDGQLLEKIVPPKPIQKVSAAWSLHDSNWFPNFPTSAKGAILFYEKTGGPTVDGVITFTPVVMQKLLEITGPIEMKDYEVVLDSVNFVEKTQYEVELDYDKQENMPKKILADLAPIVLDRIVNSNDHQTLLRSAQVFLEGLGEKHILVYSENKDLQKIISEKGWSGEILDTNKDYLSVINTNINGYKTDGVIEEQISHKAEIANDGSVVNTVSITRKHIGGNTQYEWWNKVNANYMRVYVPAGSEFLSVEGQTREFNEPPLDYEKLGFKRDKLVQQEEGNMEIDEKSGTRIYQEEGKTVFANWTYVSPQETMTITYKYKLPFRLFPSLFNSAENFDSYSLVVQKQAGSVGSGFVSEISHPQTYTAKWNYPEKILNSNNLLRLTGTLNTDKFIGVTFEKH